MERSSLFEQSGVRPVGVATPPYQSWRRGLASPVLWQNEVHVWRVNLELPWSWTFDAALSLDDRDRAARFRFDADRHRFSLARATLRMILGRYLKAEPAELQFRFGPCGKPRLVYSQNERGLRFNLSHSHELALIAVARDREVGIDVEFMRPDFATDEVAEHFFSRAEVQQLAAIEPESKTQSFFNCWTRKEAYIKARGEGLSLPLNQFDVSLVPDAPAELIDSRVDRAEVSRWSFQELFPASGYAAALALEGPFSRMLLWEFIPI